MTLIIRDEIKWRDEWLRGVLADSELSPFQRLVGIQFGLSVDLDDWPKCLGVEYAAVATSIGLPEAVVISAVAMLNNQRHWLEAYTCFGSDAVYFRLAAGPQCLRKGIQGARIAERYRRNKQRSR